MRVGISPFASSREVALELSRAAVDGGLDTLWLGDGYLANPDFAGWAGGMEPMTELAWLAGSCPSARVGIAAAVLPMRDIPWTAQQAHTLHRVAGGGLVLVVTPGFWRQDLGARGIDFDRRAEVFDDALDEILSALVDPVYSPGPSPEGPPPVWLAGAEATMRKATARGLPYQASRALPGDLAPIAAEYYDLGGPMLAHRVRVEVGDHVVAGQLVDWQAVTGSVSQVVDTFGRYRDLGVRDLSCIPGQDDDMSRATVEALVTEVLPQLG